jgi:hypothetical protein
MKLFINLLAGAAWACTLAGPALAAGPLQISTNFPSPVFAGDPYKADLASIGVNSELDHPVTVIPTGAVKLQFRLLESHAQRSGFQILSLDVGGISFAVPLQSFSASGAVLGTVTSALAFNDLIGVTDTIGPEPPPFTWGSFPVYLTDADTAALTGIGPYVGNVSKLYFNAFDSALFEVNVVTGVPEPMTWSLMILGFGLVGTQLRRRALAA